MSSTKPSDTTPLQQPLPLAPTLTLANRLVLSSLTRNRSESAPAFGVPNEWMVEYYRQRARGGFGLILTEGTLVEPQVRPVVQPRNRLASQGEEN